MIKFKHEFTRNINMQKIAEEKGGLSWSNLKGDGKTKF